MSLQNPESQLIEKTLKDQLTPYIKALPWILLSIILMSVMSYLYLRYATKMYEAKASIIIKDTRYGGSSELGALGEIGLFGNNFNSVENEIQILKSKRLMSRVVEELGLNVVYTKEGNVKESDVYKNTFVELSRLVNDSTQILDRNLNIQVRYLNDSVFQLKKSASSSWKNYLYKTPVEIGEQNFIFNPKNINFKENNTGVNGIVKIKVMPLEPTVLSYQQRIAVTPSDRRGSVVSLSIVDAVGEKAEDILDQLIVEYNKDATNDKNIIARNTAEFIDERLKEITLDLDSVERGIQRFKDQRKITDLSIESGLDLQKANEIDRQLLAVQTQYDIANLLKDSMNSNLNKSVAVAGLGGIQDLQVNGLIQQYNSLLVDYERLEKTSTLENPRMIQLVSEINTTKNSLKSSLDNYLKNLEIQKNQLSKKENSILSNISKIPDEEKVNRAIERNRKVVEAIYLLLKEKQETTAISLAVTAPKAKIVDSGYASKAPVSPKSKIIYLIAFILGALIPIGIVYLRQLFYNKIESRKDVERKLSSLAILGEVPRIENDFVDTIQPNDRSILSESFRIIRTNLQYKLGAVKHDETKIVLVTSTVKGEGKTMTAFNLASTFAYSGKKVLLVGGDIRNPQLHRYLGGKSKKTKGVTEYLVNPDLTLDELTFSVKDNPNLDIVLSGAIPPNPAELWMQDRTHELFDAVKHGYDLAIVDSAPTILVTDTFLINKFADVTVYVTRANYTDTDLLDFIKDSTDEGKLENVSLVINSVKLANFGYGNKYGYAYGEENDSFFKRLKKKIGLK